MRLAYFDNFRALAILVIILGHCYGGWVIDAPWEVALKNAVTGGTALFVFISGFFLHRVFYQRISYSAFLKKKFLAVGLPYFLLSAGFMTLYWVLTDVIPTYWMWEGLSRIQVVALNFLTGRHITAYWYVPFILVLFLLTPLFNRFIGLPKSYQAFLTTACFVAAAIFWRPAGNINPLHSVLYFSPFYLFGILYSTYTDFIDDVIAKHRLLLVSLWISVLLAMLFRGQTGNLHKLNPFELWGFDLMIPQKILLILLFLWLLKRFMNREIPVLKFIANCSFPLFFLHGWTLSILSFTSLNTLFPDGFFGVFIRFLAVTASSILATVFVRQSLQGRAKYLIGA